jgi:hypothetical protein
MNELGFRPQMTNGNESGNLWLDEERAYAVLTAHDGTARRGLSHASAMLLAEKLQRDGRVAVVVHVVGEKSYEVDRYPVR